MSEETITCPKCGIEQPTGDACRRCGLIYARWRGGDGEGYTGIAGEMWTKCEEQWDDASRHDAFLLFCRREGSLPYAAGRYRAALQQRGADDSVAVKRLAEVMKLAEFAAQAEMAKDSPRKKGSRSALSSVTLLVAGAALLLAAAVAFFFFMKMVR